MKVVGLTGGIGSGKSTVASFFRKLGVAVYIADTEAKRLMNKEESLKKEIITLLGADAYRDGQLNRAWIADRVFNDAKLLEGLNRLVHPVVAKDFFRWSRKQKGNYVIKEAAILFENGGYKHCDAAILVTAPIEERISRVMKRDGVFREQVIARLQNQWEDAKKIPLADFVIMNKDLGQTQKRVEEINKTLEISGFDND